MDGSFKSRHQHSGQDDKTKLLRKRRHWSSGAEQFPGSNSGWSWLQSERGTLWSHSGLLGAPGKVLDAH